MSDLIRREDAIKAVEECLKLLARPRYTVKTAIEAIPSVDIPHNDDWEKYSDKLWRNAYERGKADRPQEWIPCKERLPREYEVLCCDIYKNCIVGHPFADDSVSTGFCAESEGEFMYECVAWMPLPKPWEGADDDIH